MAENTTSAGTIEAKVVIGGINEFRKSLRNLETALKVGTGKISGDINVITGHIEKGAKKTGATLTSQISEYKKAHQLLIQLFKKTTDDQVNERKYILEQIKLVDDIILREQRLAETRKKAAEKAKKDAKEVAAAKREEAKAAKEATDAEDIGAGAGGGGVHFSPLGLLQQEAMRALRTIMRKVYQSFRELVEVSKEYEASLANTQAVAQATAVGLEALDRAAQRAGMMTKFTASEAAEGLYQLASAGFDAFEATDALNGVLMMATATNETIADTAQMVAATIHQFNLEARDSEKVANILTASISTSQATLSRLRQSMTQAGTVAAGLGIELEEVVGVLDLMYDSGMQSSRAGRAMRNIMAELSNESSRTVKKLKELGIAFEDIDLSQNSLVDSLAHLSESGLSTGQVMDAFGKVIGPQMTILVRSSRKEIEEYVDTVTDTNRAATAAATQIDNLKGDMLLLKSAWQAVGITVSKLWIPAVRAAVQVGTSLLRSVNNLIGDMFQLNSMFDKFKRTTQSAMASVDEYKRQTDMLKNSTNSLTEAQRKLYEVEQKRSRAKLLDTLREQNAEYSKQEAGLKDIEKAYAAATGVEDFIESYRELVRQYDAYDKSIGSQQEIMAQYQKVVNGSANATNALNSALGSTVSGNARTAIVDLRALVNSLNLPPSETSGTRRNIKDANNDIGMLIKTLDKADRQFTIIREQYSDAGILTRNLAQYVSVVGDEYEMALGAVTDSINMYASWLSQGIIKEEEVLANAPQMAEAIFKERDAIEALTDAGKKNTVYTAAGLKQMMDNLDLTQEMREALQKEIDKTLESNRAEVLKGRSMKAIEAVYQSRINSIARETRAEEKAIEEKRKEREERALNREEVDEEIEAMDGYTAAYENNDIAIIQNLINKAAENDLAVLSAKRAFDERDARIELTKAVIAATRAEEDLVNERKYAYKESTYSASEAEKKVLQARERILKDFSDIENAHSVNMKKSVDEVRRRTEERLAINERLAEQELLILSAKRDEEVKELNKTYDERLRDLERNKDNMIQATDEMYGAFLLSAQNKAATEIAELNQEYDQKILIQEQYRKTDTENEDKYNAEIERLNEERASKIGVIESRVEGESAAATESRTAIVLGIEQQHTKDVIAETQARWDAQNTYDNEYRAESLASAEEYNAKRVEIEKEGADEIKKIHKSTLKDYEGFTSAIQSLFNDLASVAQAFYDAEVRNIERNLETKLTAIETEKNAALEAAGFRLDTERETLEKRLAEAKRSADEETIIEAERALEKFEIEEDYRLRTEEAEEEARIESGKQKFKAAQAQLAFTLTDIALSTARAIMQIWAEAPLLAPWRTGIATAAGIAQATAAMIAAPKQSDYYGTGGIIRGSAAGTPLIAGEGGRTEAIFNPDQMANLLMAIAQGRGAGGGTTEFTIVVKNMYDKELARYVIEDVVNKGVVLIDGQRGIKGVAR